MGLIFWWMVPIWIAVIVAYWVIRYIKRRRSKISGKNAIPIAHASRLTDTPQYKLLLKQYKVVAGTALFLMSAGLLAGILLTARAARTLETSPLQRSRDVMLCLDVSGSVLKADSALLNFYSEFVESFEGQRFGVTLFNSSAVALMPLNNNYPLISQALKKSSEAFRVQEGQDFNTLTTGTLSGFSGGTSLAGDGLATCMQYLGNNADKRSQSVILATDNEAFGTPLISMEKNKATAKEKGIHVYVIDPGISDPNLATKHGELQSIASHTGGKYYAIKNLSIDAVVNDISRHESANYSGVAQAAKNDQPQIFIYIAALGVITALAIMWRLEL